MNFVIYNSLNTRIISSIDGLFAIDHIFKAFDFLKFFFFFWETRFFKVKHEIVS